MVIETVFVDLGVATELSLAFVADTLGSFAGSLLELNHASDNSISESNPGEGSCIPGSRRIRPLGPQQQRGPPMTLEPGLALLAQPALLGPRQGEQEWQCTVYDGQQLTFSHGVGRELPSY